MDERVLTPELAKQLFGPRDLNTEQPEPPVEGRPPGNKPVSEYTQADPRCQAGRNLAIIERIHPGEGEGQV